MKERKVVFTGAIVGAVAKNLRDDVRGTENLGAIPQDFPAFGDVLGVRIAGFGTGAGFNDYFQSYLGQIGNHGGHKRYAPLPRKSLAGHTDNHEAASDTQELSSMLIRILAGRHCTPALRMSGVTNEHGRPNRAALYTQLRSVKAFGAFIKDPQRR